VLLAAQPDRQVAQLLARSKPNRLTPRTRTEPAQLMQAVRAARELGYAISEEEIELGLRSIAVPLRDAPSNTVAAMSLAVRTATMTREQTVERLLPALETARRSLAPVL
jgi:IclR family transcriptional regulator, pca regulon regulatory protein